MLHIICALKPEAAPLLDHFRLRPQATPSGAPRIYQDRDATISLTRCGMGAAAAAAAADFTREYFQADKTHAWLNTGVAGHADLPLGQAVFIKKVTDAATRQSWFPSRAFATVLPACDLVTLERPGRAYQAEVFDMECAGFFRAVTKFATLELVHSIKIISDNAAQPMEQVRPALIRRLVAQNLPAIEDVAKQLQTLAAVLRPDSRAERDFAALTARRRFSVSRQHQLRELLKKWRARCPEAPGLPAGLETAHSPEQLLERLRDQLERAPLRLRPPPRGDHD